MEEAGQGWRIFYYTTARGDSPPRDYVKALPPTERAKVNRCLDLLREFGPAFTGSQVKHLTGTDLWELRPDAHRLIYVTVTGRRFVILHAFRKTSTRMRKKDMNIALTRRDELLRRMSDER